jgi:hypothetical protein
VITLRTKERSGTGASFLIPSNHVAKRTERTRGAYLQITLCDNSEGRSCEDGSAKYVVGGDSGVVEVMPCLIDLFRFLSEIPVVHRLSEIYTEDSFSRCDIAYIWQIAESCLLMLDVRSGIT